MTLLEAYQFLDLPENASKAALAARFKEKNHFFQMLHDNAPNASIRNLQQKNLQWLAEIKKLMPEIDGIIPAAGSDIHNNRQTEKEKQTKATGNRNPENEDALAWLVVHTEGKPVESFPLYEGENPVGRNEVPGKKSIVLSGDNYISRFHCTLILGYSHGEMAAAIADDGRYNNKKPSMNGTFYNGIDNRITMQKLKEGDTVQIGLTKLVFKWNTAHRNDIEEEVALSGFIMTVVIDL